MSLLLCCLQSIDHLKTSGMNMNRSWEKERTQRRPYRPIRIPVAAKWFSYIFPMTYFECCCTVCMLPCQIVHRTRSYVVCTFITGAAQRQADSQCCRMYTGPSPGLKGGADNVIDETPSLTASQRNSKSVFAALHAIHNFIGVRPQMNESLRPRPSADASESTHLCCRICTPNMAASKP